MRSYGYGPAFLLLILLLLLSLPAFANPVMARLILDTENIGPILIGISILVELPFVKRITKSGWGRSCLLNIMMNFFSTLPGLIFFPINEIVFEKMFSDTYAIGFSVVMFFFISFLILLIIDIVIESLVIWILNATKLNRSGYLWLSIANTITLSIGYFYLVVISYHY